MKNFNFLIVLTSILAFACSDKTKIQADDAMGQINLNIVADGTTIPLKSKVDEPILTPEMFQVRIESAEGEILRNWDSFNDLPNPININAGNYKFVAWYGNSTLPVWDKPYYEGVTNFNVAPGENKNINVKCSLAAVKVKVNFASSFEIFYSFYAVEINTQEGENKMLIFDTETQGKEAYFAQGNMNIRFRLVSKADGKTYFFSANTIPTVNRESYTFNMSAIVNQGVGSIIINTDESTNDKDPIEVIIPR